MNPCPICGARSDARLLAQARNVSSPIAEQLSRASNPWTRAQTACPQCVLQAARAHAHTRSAFALHTRTEPATTFPYYHPEDESVLGLAERLPDYFTLPAKDVGIGFLDSGFYPHPDLCALPAPAAVQWERLSPSQMRATILDMQPRFLDYVDLAGDRDAHGMDLESLWDGEGVAWHGQMTSVIAAGNGALSGGRYRGYAPEARILPIKIGRGDGRVPERDILEGLNWLLAGSRWQRYGIRVLNISVGGDFPQDWRLNPVCQAVEALSAQGLLVVAAAGNRPIEELLAPAQAPAALTVGGMDDYNRRIEAASGMSNGADARLALYHHNFGAVSLHGARPDASQPVRKPEILAPGRYVPSPILPVHSIFREMHAIARLRQTLAGDDARTDALVAHWQRMLHTDGPITGAHTADLLEDDERIAGEWMGDVWKPLRKRMNATKWTHACYQHVDGTSVAAAVVSAVAAQIVQANPALGSAQIKQILCDSALAIPAFPQERRGAGIVQPARAVAMALRAASGRLAGYPVSGSVLVGDELRKWLDLAKIETVAETAASNPGNSRHITRHANNTGAVYSDNSDSVQWVYFGILAPGAERVALTGEFNAWQVDTLLLCEGRDDWWHGVLPLPRGLHAYRFWVQEKNGAARWIADPESTLRIESGYGTDHSAIRIA